MEIQKNGAKPPISRIVLPHKVLLYVPLLTLRCYATADFGTTDKRVCMKRSRVYFAAVLVCLLAAPCLAQAPTGTISGHVVSADHQALPGVTVSVTSPSLQGSRTTV